MSTTKLKPTSDRGPVYKIIERLKKFMDAFIKQIKKPSVKEIPVKELKPKVKPAPKRVAVKKKTTTRRTKPKANTEA